MITKLEDWGTEHIMLGWGNTGGDTGWRLGSVTLVGGDFGMCCLFMDGGNSLLIVNSEHHIFFSLFLELNTSYHT